MKPFFNAPPSIRQTVVGLLFFGLLVSTSACIQNNIQTVDYVDVDAYMGKWYQISAYETFFNSGLVAVTAEYTLLEDGTVKVLNRGLRGDFDGEPDEIEGNAVVVDEESNAKLRVSFPGIPNFSSQQQGNYWIVVLDDVNYQYAAVTDPLGSTLFILSRTPFIDELSYNFILEKLETMGIATDKLVLTPQE